MLNFSDGVTINTDGPVRKLRLKDGLYVVGDGMCIPVNSHEEADEVINELKEVSVN
jgi:hypothetical protein